MNNNISDFFGDQQKYAENYCSLKIFKYPLCKQNNKLLNIHAYERIVVAIVRTKNFEALINIKAHYLHFSVTLRKLS